MITQLNNEFGKPCEGEKAETKRCDTPCEKEPVDCVLSEWDYWTDCDKSCGGGQRFRTRTVVTQLANGGKPCQDYDNLGHPIPAALKETESCNTDACQAQIDCVMSEWSTWGGCSATCGGGQQYRTRTVESEAMYGGVGCQGQALSQVQGCGQGACADQVDCVWGDWTDYGACSATCGGGMKFRDRHIAVAPRNGGKLCDPKVKTEVAPCNTHGCGAGAVDGEWSEWSDWSTCSASCGGGYQLRSREIAVTPNDIGSPVVGDAQEYRSCNAQDCAMNIVDCVLSEWSYWGDCSCDCNGVKDRSRRVETYASGGGKLCSGALKEVVPCNVPGGGDDGFSLDEDGSATGTGVCGDIPIDAVVSEWSAWGDCTAACGSGTMERTRHIVTPAQGGGSSFSGSLAEVAGCNTQACDAEVDCLWGEWHAWGACSKPCGGGQKRRFRHINQMPKHGGVECLAQDSAETMHCNAEPCGSVQYCAWGEWSAYSSCSTTCGTGTMHRERALELTTYAPASEDDILVTGVLAAISESMTKGFATIDAVKLDHVGLIFMSGMVMSVAMMVSGYHYLKRGTTSGVSIQDDSAAVELIEHVE
jgi:hypothetical protein